jgi:2',3'-cyclic-nucleotide 2'-phosphodiesterase (5'-nucleotidase family)
VGCDVGIINSGGIRASISAPLTPGSSTPITEGDLSSIAPFDSDGFEVAEVSGADLLSALEHHATLGQGNGGALQVAGMRFSWSDGHQTGSGASVLTVEIFDKASSSFVALRKERVYKVATVSYLLQGGDGYAMLKRARLVSDDGEKMRICIGDFIANRGCSHLSPGIFSLLHVSFPI